MLPVSTLFPPSRDRHTLFTSPYLEPCVVLRAWVSLYLAGNEELSGGDCHSLGSCYQLLLLCLALHHRVGCFTQVACGTGNQLSLWRGGGRKGRENDRDISEGQRGEALPYLKAVFLCCD